MAPRRARIGGARGAGGQRRGVEPDDHAVQHDQRRGDPVAHRSDEAHQQAGHDRQHHRGQRPAGGVRSGSRPRCRARWPACRARPSTVMITAGESSPLAAPVLRPPPTPGRRRPSRAARSSPACGRSRRASRRTPIGCAAPAGNRTAPRPPVPAFAGGGGRPGTARATVSHATAAVRPALAKASRQPNASASSSPSDVGRRAGNADAGGGGR